MTTLIPKFDLKNGGTSPAGAINRPINQKLAESLSVLDFGAVADGNKATNSGTDNYAAFVATCNAAVAMSNIYYTPKVKIPAGVYYFASTWIIPDGIHVEGDGIWNTVLVCPASLGSGNGISVLNTGSGAWVTLSDFSINGVLGSNTGAAIATYKNSTLLYNLLVGGFGTGFLINNGDVFLSNFIADGADTAVSANAQAIHITDGTSYGGLIGVKVSNIAAGGIGTVSITDFRCNGANYCGFYLKDAGQVQLSNCSANAQDYLLFRDSGTGPYGALWIEDSYNITINGFQGNINSVQNPSVTTTTSNGINIKNSKSVEVSSSVLTGWLDGINLLNTNNSSFTNVYSVSNLRAGTFLQTTSVNNNFSGCSFNSNVYGIYISGSSADNTFCGNQIKTNSGAGVLTTTIADKNYEINNIVNNTTNFSLAGYTWRTKFRGSDVVYASPNPSAGTWSAGDRVINFTPAVGSPKSWVCTVSGTPGTWVSEGNL